MASLISGLPLNTETPPLRADEGGVIRVGKSRVSLDLVVEQYENGMTPEDLVRAYDTLDLADVYAALAYYHRHREAVAAYLDRREAEAQTLRARIEVDHSREAIVKKIMARRIARGLPDATPDH